MTKLKILTSTAVLLSSFVATPMMAEQAVSEPGLCAQNYRNSDCNKGSDTSYAMVTQRIAAGYRNEGYRPRYASNYGWAEIQALRAFERMR